VFGDQGADRRGHALDRDDEVVSAIVHVVDVTLAEVAPVQDEADIAVPIYLLAFSSMYCS
jgi:hypothetical protein